MPELMEEDGVVGFGPAAVGAVDEQALVGHLDVIAGQPVVGSLAAVADVGAGGSDHRVSPGIPLDRTEVLRQGRELEAFDLADVEDAAGLGDPALAVVIVGLGLNLKFLVEDDDGALGALLHLRTDLLPLLVGGPEIVGKAGELRLGPQGDDVDAAIAVMGGGVLGKEAVEAGTVPRHGDGIGGGFKGGNDAVGDGLVDIEGLSGAGHGIVLFSAGPHCPAPRPRKPARAGSRTP